MIRNSGRFSYRNQPKYFPKHRNQAEKDREDPNTKTFNKYSTGIIYGRNKYNPSEGTEYRGLDYYREEPMTVNYEPKENPSATRHISYYDDDISDIENSILREGGKMLEII